MHKTVRIHTLVVTMVEMTHFIKLKIYKKFGNVTNFSNAFRKLIIVRSKSKFEVSQKLNVTRRSSNSNASIDAIKMPWDKK